MARERMLGVGDASFPPKVRYKRSTVTVMNYEMCRTREEMNPFQNMGIEENQRNHARKTSRVPIDGDTLLLPLLSSRSSAALELLLGISMSGNAAFQAEDQSADALAQLQEQAMSSMMSKMEELCLVMCLVGVGATFAATLQGACFKIFSELQAFKYRIQYFDIVLHQESISRGL